jgi:cytochrome c biogenesis protein CcmG/thiol:disulfide interchange protein DsbE
LIRVAGLLLVCLLAACAGAPSAPSEPAATTSPAPSRPAGKVSGDLAALKEAAGIEACPATGDREATGEDALPSIVLPCLGGGPVVRLSGLLDRPTLINVWASWCGPCRKELPLLGRAHREFGDRVVFLGIDAGDDAVPAIGLLDELDVTFPQVSDSSMRTRGPLGYGAGLPLTVFVDAQGRMIGTERTPFRSYSDVTAALRKHFGVGSEETP